MRLLLLTAVPLLFACTPPCVEAARRVCDIESQGDACSFLLNRDRNDQPAQALCREILPAARGLGDDPHSPAAWADWKGARQKLVQAGLHEDPRHGDIAQKLIRADGVAGHLVKSLEDHSTEAEQRTTEGAQRALDGERQ